MNFSKRDVGIIIAMTIAIFAMSFTFPALGMGGNEISDSDIPTFNASEGDFENLAEEPDRPGSPTYVQLVRQNGNPNPSTTGRWIYGDDENGLFSTLFNDGNLSDPVADIVMRNYTDGSDTQETISLQNVGDTQLYDEGEYEINIEFEEVRDRNTSEMTMYVGLNIVEQPSDQSWISRIPLVGGIFSASQQLASIVGWIGSILFYFLIGFGTWILNTFFLIIDIVSFFLGLMHWLIMTYTSIISGAPTGWAGAIIAIPGLLLSLEFVKVIMVIIDLMPTT